MHNQSPSSDPSRLQTVEDVNGSSISVKLSENTPGGLMFVNGEAYRVGQVGGFVRIPSGYFDFVRDHLAGWCGSRPWGARPTLRGGGA